MQAGRVKQLVAVALVATTLAADRALAAPALRPQVAEAARGFASRLVCSLQRSVPSQRLLVCRRDGDDTRIAPAPRPPQAPLLRWPQFTPFQFRLPPPVV
jgi:hypothetical protein